MNNMYSNNYSLREKQKKIKKTIRTIIIILIVCAAALALIGLFSGNTESTEYNAVAENTRLKLQISEQQETINKLQLEIDRLNQELAERPLLPSPVIETPFVSPSPVPEV